MGCVCMSNITMMELSRELDEQFDRLVNECRVSGEINQELYTNMTSNVVCVMPMVKVY